ncbi:hypothetical protein TorRG33x02_133480 [Trema orientale]|uniref:Uncharacterized protein n=1 Tax=Trema orientale TaxID=63057 RepID=A0A2P5EZI7_TREOI|nr:hypothetical protein TorRG33x02_133480 [Trema orientale]
MSIEALAMAGVDYAEAGIHIEEWEQKPPATPLYLLADDDQQNFELLEKKKKRDHIFTVHGS